jgi:hypothetical protein
MSRRTAAARAGAALIASALAAGLAGCTFPDVSMSPGVSMPSAASTTEATTASAAPTTGAQEAAARPTAPKRVSGDLDTGTVTHKLAAGARTVVIDYWTDEDAKDWTAAGTKTIQVSAHLEGGVAQEAVKVTRFVVTVDDGSTRTTAAEDRGEFMITPPFSYTTALSILPSPADTTALTVYIQFELLVETEPGSQQYFRQTVLDTLRLPLIEEDDQ